MSKILYKVWTETGDFFQTTNQQVFQAKLAEYRSKGIVYWTN